MDLALALLLLWGLLFVPIGLVLHWIVLGEGSSQRALVVAPITGLAVAFVTLAALGRFGIDGGDTWVAWAFVAASLVSVVLIWRLEVPWRSRELLGLGALLLLTVALIQMPVIGQDGDGPLGFRTTANPVTEVAAIDAAAHGPASQLGVSRSAAATADERPIGFEQFAALTVAIGADETPEDARAATWSAYGLHAPITGMLAALILLPLFAFARARGVRWLGLLVLVPLGVLAPSVFLALANGEGAAIASVPFTTAAVFSLLVTRRDRGWWALVVLFGSAALVSAGLLALLPLTAIGIAWMLLRSSTYEHLSQHDAPVSTARTLIVTAAAAALAGFASLAPISSGGSLLAWHPLHQDLSGALLSWPFAWLDTDLGAAGPVQPLEIAIWLIGPALVAMALIYAIVRNERRELGVLVGAIAAASFAAIIGLIEPRAGIRLFEFTMLSLSPFLAALAVRAVALARENAEDLRDTRHGRVAGVGPTLLVVAFTVMSFAATSVTGTRMVHAPLIDIASASATQARTLIAAGDPWLEFVIDGQRVAGGYADADSPEVMEQLGLRAEGQGFDSVLLSTSPWSSDPPRRFIEQSDLDAYQVRLFRNVFSDPPPSRDLAVDQATFTQRARAETADRSDETAAAGADAAPDAAGGEQDSAADADADGAAGAAADGVVDAAIDAVEPAVPAADRHIPVEGLDVSTPADEPAGLLVPDGNVPDCEVGRDIVVSGTCEPSEPVRGEGCTDEDVAAARSPLDRDNPRGARAKPAGAPLTGRIPVLEVDADSLLPRRPKLIGVQCFDVPLGADSRVLSLHLRDVGHILTPQSAHGRGGEWTMEGGDGDGTADAKAAESVSLFDAPMRSSSERGATLEYGDGRLAGNHDIVVEGEFGAGVSITSSFAIGEGASEEATQVDPTELGTLRGAADGFSQIVRSVPLSGSVTVDNDAGTDISIGRMFARPRDLPPSCDMPIALAAGAHREVRIAAPPPTGGEAVERPGLSLRVVSIDAGADGARVARIALGSYLSRAGLPRYMLADWTEQFEQGIQIEGCDGVITSEDGAEPAGADAFVDPADLAGALADRADAIDAARDEASASADATR